MINCEFENGNKANLRHATADSIVLDKTHTKILLAKRGPKFSNPGKMAIPGGFMERDESIKEAIIREVLEETGYKVRLLDLFCINDDPKRAGEDRQNITFIYLSEAQQKVGEYDHEIEGIDWYDLDNLPPAQQFAFDHFKTVQKYIEYKKEPFKLPYFQSEI